MIRFEIKSIWFQIPCLSLFLMCTCFQGKAGSISKKIKMKIQILKTDNDTDHRETWKAILIEDFRGDGIFKAEYIVEKYKSRVLKMEHGNNTYF